MAEQIEIIGCCAILRRHGDWRFRQAGPIAMQPGDCLLVDLSQQAVALQLAANIIMVVHRHDKTAKQRDSARAPPSEVFAIPACDEQHHGRDKRHHAQIHHHPFPPRKPLFSRRELLDALLVHGFDRNIGRNFYRHAAVL